MNVMDSFIVETLKHLLVGVGILVAYAEFAQAKDLKGSGYAWVKWALGLMGLYWAAYYTNSIISTALGFRLPAHQVWVRAPLLLTLSFIAAGALLSLKRRKGGGK